MSAPCPLHDYPLPYWVDKPKFGLISAQIWAYRSSARGAPWRPPGWMPRVWDMQGESLSQLGGAHAAGHGLSGAPHELNAGYFGVSRGGPDISSEIKTGSHHVPLA